MKVICRSIIDNGTKVELTQHHRYGISVGEEYVVLALHIRPTLGISVWIFTQKNMMPALYDLNGFEISSQKIPDNWIFRINRFNFIDIMPEIWFENNFINDLVEELTYAVELFCQVATSIYQEEGEVFPIIPEQYNKSTT